MVPKCHKSLAAAYIIVWTEAQSWPLKLMAKLPKASVMAGAHAWPLSPESTAAFTGLEERGTSGGFHCRLGQCRDDKTTTWLSPSVPIIFEWAFSVSFEANFAGGYPDHLERNKFCKTVMPPSRFVLLPQQLELNYQWSVKSADFHWVAFLFQTALLLEGASVQSDIRGHYTSHSWP